MEPQDSVGVLGSFFVVPSRKERHVELEETKHYLANGQASRLTPARRSSGRVRRTRADGRPEVLRPARHVAAHDAADQRPSTSRPSTRASASTARRSAAGRGSPSRTCSSCRTPSTAILDPVHRGADALADLRDRRSDHARAVRQGSAPASRKRAEEYLHSTGIADTAFFGPGVRVLRLRRGLVRARPEPLALLGRLGRGPLELGQARARLHGPREGGLLPARAARHAARPAHARWC